MIDFHTHILPGIDDGAKNVEESLQMLNMELSQGIKHIVCTPHFDAEKDLSEYLLKHRRQAYDKLIEAVNKSNTDIPDFYLASEVRLTRNLSSCSYLKELRIADTNYILIELPYNNWINKWVPEELYAIKAKTGLNIILAHAERYIINKMDFKVMEEILSEVDVVQINAEAFMVREGRKWIKKFIKADCAIIVGSDCHSPKHRKPCVGDALRIIDKKFGKEYTQAFIENAKVILDI